MPPPIDQVARHSWIVVQEVGKPLRRYELGSSGGQNPFDDFAAGDVMLHGVVTGTEEEIEAIDRCLAEADHAYYKVHPDYFPIPGPNSNTFVAFLDRKCALGVELPPTAIGRDYVGIWGADLTEGRTGIQIGSIPFGVRLGLREGVSVQIFGLPIGLHLAPPGLDLPINPGRLGFTTDEHIYRAPHGDFTSAFPTDPAKNGAASVELGAAVYSVLDPKKANGLDGEGLLSFSARAVYGKFVGYAAGLDLEMGASVPSGVAGGAHLYPLGIGVLLSPTGFLAVFQGIGASGVSARLPSGLELPLEERLEIDVGPRARVALFGRQTFVTLEPGREVGLFGLGESTFGIRARVGNGWGYDNGAIASGYFFGFERREIAGSAMIGAIVGTEIDAGYSERRSSTPDADARR